MDLKMLPVYIIVFLVLIVLPIVLGRQTGKNPVELLFGKQASDLIFGKRKRRQEEAAGGKAAGKPSGPLANGSLKGAAAEADGAAGAAGGRNKKTAGEKNSSRQELMTAISALLSYARKYRFYCIVPGTLVHGDEVASLAALVVTRSQVIGFNCFGYGGTVYAGSGDGPWRQVIGGEEKKIDSPTVRNRKQREILEAVLQECGYPDVSAEIYGVFTAAGVTLKDTRSTRCYTQKAMMEVLKGNRFMDSRGVDPAKVGKALEAHIKRKEKKT